MVESKKTLTPREIVDELNRYIIGQDDAKKAVAVALRNRWRRQQLPQEMQDDIIPKNIIMMGPTGVGKTEIARRLAKLAQSPFYKVEASKFTEVGYVGRDVESMIRDLMEIAIGMVKQEERAKVELKAKKMAASKIVDILKKEGKLDSTSNNLDSFYVSPENNNGNTTGAEEDVLDGKYDDVWISLNVEIQAIPMMNIMGPQGNDMMDHGDFNIMDIVGNMFPKQKKQKKLRVKDAIRILTTEESGKMIDMESVQREARKRVEQNGIIFLDEIDKIASSGKGHGPDVSREGVQRDILPIVEGSSVNTKYGMVKTDHILFIAAGAFHMTKPSDLIPELQGRFPIRVELQSLTTDDFIRILKEPQNSLIKQYTEMMKTEGVYLTFEESALLAISEIAFEVNLKMENIGARRLHTVLEKLLEELSFSASDLEEKNITIDESYVKTVLSSIVQNQDLSRYVL
ncbi:ATP-dependent protease ATPase subunit HslU [bacterium]|nr:ATP-dependent protease ATPase subunit HslU [bacterium]